MDKIDIEISMPLPSIGGPSEGLYPRCCERSSCSYQMSKKSWTRRLIAGCEALLKAPPTIREWTRHQQESSNVDIA